MLWDLGEVDRETLSAYVLAKVKPREAEGKFQLPPSGVFLKADLEGAVLTDVVKVSRAAIRGQNRVFVLGEGNRLKTRTLTIVRRGVDEVFAIDGIKAGEKIILNRIEMPVEDMELIEATAEEPLVD